MPNMNTNQLPENITTGSQLIAYIAQAFDLKVNPEQAKDRFDSNAKPYVSFYLNPAETSWYPISKINTITSIINLTLNFTGLQFSNENFNSLITWIMLNQKNTDDWMVTIYPKFNEQTGEYSLCLRLAITELKKTGKNMPAKRVPKEQITVETKPCLTTEVPAAKQKAFASLFKGFCIKHNLFSVTEKQLAAA